MARNRFEGLPKTEKNWLREYYAANIVWLQEQLARTDMSDARKKYLAITPERLQEFISLRNELNESCVSGWSGDGHPQNW